MHSHMLLCCSPFVTGLGKGGRAYHGMHVNLIKGRESCTDHQLHSLILAYLDLVVGCSQDSWRSAVSFVSHCALLAFHSTLLAPPSCPLNHLVVSSTQSTRSSLHILRETSPNSLGAQGLLTTLTCSSLPAKVVSIVWPLLHVNSCLETQVGVGCQLGTSGG